METTATTKEVKPDARSKRRIAIDDSPRKSPKNKSKRPTKYASLTRSFEPAGFDLTDAALDPKSVRGVRDKLVFQYAKTVVDMFGTYIKALGRAEADATFPWFTEITIKTPLLGDGELIAIVKSIEDQVGFSPNVLQVSSSVARFQFDKTDLVKEATEAEEASVADEQAEGNEDESESESAEAAEGEEGCTQKVDPQPATTKAGDV